MSRTFIGELPIFLLLIAGSITGKQFSDIQTLTDGSVLQVNITHLHNYTPYMKQIAIGANSKSTFNVTNVSSSASFIIFQIHVYQHNVTLSFDKDYLNKVSNRSVYGSNIGLFSRLTRNIITQLFVKNDYSYEVRAMLVAIAYNDKAPIPGGCNMEFNTEIAPYAKVQTLPAMVIVDVQPSSLPESNNSHSICEKNPVIHEMYQMFLSEQDFSIENYFTGISRMLTVQDIMENGEKVASPIVTSPMRRVFSAYTGVGSVYVAVATYGQYSAAYVPAFSYACYPVRDPHSCEIFPNGFSKFVCVSCFILGFISILVGHWFLPGDMALPVFFTGTVIGYAMQGDLGIALLIGLFYTIIWIVGMWCIWGSLLFSLSLGLFFSCVAYLHTSDSFIILQNDWVFWTLFLILTIAISLFTMLLSVCTFPITCAIYSSLMMVLSLDYFVGSSLKYLVINIVRRISVEDFNLAVVQPPSQTADTVLIVLWVCLALFRFMKQFYSGAISPEMMPLLG